MSYQTVRLQFQTRGSGELIDITGDVERAAANSGFDGGIAALFVPGSTAALTTIEYESGALSDFQRLFEEIAAENREYKHNLRWQDGNGHSHVRAALLGPSLTVPFADGKLMLGTWQQIILADFDNRARQRTVICQVIG